MNISQKFINIILSIIIIYLVFQFEKTKERMTLIEDITEEQIQRAGEVAKTTHTNEIILRNNFKSHYDNKTANSYANIIKCNLHNSFNSDEVLKNKINISLNKNKDILVFNDISASGKEMNDYVNGEQFMFWGNNPKLSYMINIPKKEFHIHSHDGSMIIYKCNL